MAMHVAQNPLRARPWPDTLNDTRFGMSIEKALAAIGADDMNIRGKCAGHRRIDRADCRTGRVRGSGGGNQVPLRLVAHRGRRHPEARLQQPVDFVRQHRQCAGREDERQQDRKLQPGPLVNQPPQTGRLDPGSPPGGLRSAIHQPAIHQNVRVTSMNADRGSPGKWPVRSIKPEVA